MSANRKRPKAVAVVGDACTGCAGSPVCVELCPVEGCMTAVPDSHHHPFMVVVVDAATCIGCRKCVTSGPGGLALHGCPWDAIDMLPAEKKAPAEKGVDARPPLPKSKHEAPGTLQWAGKATPDPRIRRGNSGSDGPQISPMTQIAAAGASN